MAEGYLALAVDQQLGEAASVAPVDEVHALPPEDRLGAAGRRDDGRLIQVQDDAEPVGPALATKPLGIPVHFRLRVSQVLGEAALRWSDLCPPPRATGTWPTSSSAWTRAGRLSQHPDEHRPEYPVFLAVDQELGEGSALGVAPELADPVRPLEVGEHEDVEQLGAGSRTEGVEALP